MTRNWYTVFAKTHLHLQVTITHSGTREASTCRKAHTDSKEREREREASWYFCSVTAWNERFATYNTHALLEKKKGKMYNLPTTNAALYSPRGF